MGIPRRKSLKENLRVVSVYDTAIDWSLTPRVDYVMSRDIKLVKTLPGQALDVFELRNLPTLLVSELRTRESPKREELFFLWSVTSCTGNLLSWDGHGEDRKVSIHSLDNIPTRIITEIGSVADQFASLTQAEKKAYKLPLGLPAIPTPPQSTAASDAAPSK